MNWISDKDQSAILGPTFQKDPGTTPPNYQANTQPILSNAQFGALVTEILDLARMRSDLDLREITTVKLAAANFSRQLPQSKQLLRLHARLRQYLWSRVNQMEAEALYVATGEREWDRTLIEDLIHDYIVADRRVHADIEAIREEVCVLFWSTYSLFQSLNLHDRVLESLNLQSIIEERHLLGYEPPRVRVPGSHEFPIEAMVPMRALYRNLDHGESNQFPALSREDAHDLAREMNNRMREMFGNY